MIKQFLVLLVGFFSILFLACSAQNGEDKLDLTIEEFKAKMDEENIVILDVRTPEEIANGKVEGAVEIDFRAKDFTQQIEALDKNKTYLVYCASGNRSSKAVKIMHDQGFLQIHNLLGGYGAWKAQMEKTE